MSPKSYDFYFKVCKFRVLGDDINKLEGIVSTLWRRWVCLRHMTLSLILSLALEFHEMHHCCEYGSARCCGCGDIAMTRVFIAGPCDLEK